MDTEFLVQIGILIPIFAAAVVSIIVALRGQGQARDDANVSSAQNVALGEGQVIIHKAALARSLDIDPDALGQIPPSDAEPLTVELPVIPTRDDIIGGKRNA